jgi:hypothetical protein
MLRKSLLFALGLLSATANVARAQGVIEPYPQTAPPVRVQVPPVQVQPVQVQPVQVQPVQVQPVQVVPVPVPAQPQYVEPPAQYPASQYYPPPNYYVQPNYMPAPPPRFKTIETPRYGLMTAGLVVLGVSWSVNALSGYLADEWRLAVPVVGPFMYAHEIDNSSDFGTRTAIAFLVLDGLVESAGAAMFLAGVLTHHQVRVMEHAKIMVVPTAGIASATSGASAGLAAFGRF